MSFKDDLLAKIRGTKTLEQLERLGFTHGKNLKMMFGVVIDWGALLPHHETATM